MQRRDLFIEVLGQHVDLFLVVAGFLPELHLRQHLVGERRTHDETGMPRGAAQVDQPPLGQQDDPLAVGKLDLVHLRLDVGPFEVTQAFDLNLGIEVADIADDGPVLHLADVVDGDDVDVAGAGDEDVALGRGLFHGYHLEAFHRRLQGADGIGLGDQHPAARTAQAFGRALADVAVAGDHGHLAGHHHVGGAADAVNQAFAAAVFVVELGLGHRIVDVDGRKQKLALGFHFIKTVHAGRRFLGDALDVLGRLGVPAGFFAEPLFDRGEQGLFFFIVGLFDDAGVVCGVDAEVQQQRRVAAVVENHVRPAAVGPFEDSVRVIPVFLQGFALGGENGDFRRRDGRRRVVLGRIDVARRPADVGAQRLQGFDQHRRLDGHVQRSGDARALQRLLAGEFLADRHQAGHFRFGEGNFLLTPLGQRKIGDLVIIEGHGSGT